MTDERKDCQLQRAFEEHSTDSDDDLQDEWVSCASEDDSSRYGAVTGPYDSGETRGEDVKMRGQGGEIVPGEDVKMSSGGHEIRTEHIDIGYSCSETNCEKIKTRCSLDKKQNEIVKTRSDYGNRRGDDVKTSYDDKALHLEENRKTFDRSVSQSGCYSTCLESAQNSPELDQFGIELDHTCSCLTRPIRSSDQACHGREVVGQRSGQRFGKREDCPHHSSQPINEQNVRENCVNREKTSSPNSSETVDESTEICNLAISLQGHLLTRKSQIVYGTECNYGNVTPPSSAVLYDPVGSHSHTELPRLMLEDECDSVILGEGSYSEYEHQTPGLLCTTSVNNEQHLCEIQFQPGIHEKHGKDERSLETVVSRNNQLLETFPVRDVENIIITVEELDSVTAYDENILPDKIRFNEQDFTNRKDSRSYVPPPKPLRSPDRNSTLYCKENYPSDSGGSWRYNRQALPSARENHYIHFQDEIKAADDLDSTDNNSLYDITDFSCHVSSNTALDSYNSSPPQNCVGRATGTMPSGQPHLSECSDANARSKNLAVGMTLAAEGGVFRDEGARFSGPTPKDRRVCRNASYQAAVSRSVEEATPAGDPDPVSQCLAENCEVTGLNFRVESESPTKLPKDCPILRNISDFTDTGVVYMVDYIDCVPGNEKKSNNKNLVKVGACEEINFEGENSASVQKILVGKEKSSSVSEISLDSRSLFCQGRFKVSPSRFSEGGLSPRSPFGLDVPVPSNIGRSVSFSDQILLDPESQWKLEQTLHRARSTPNNQFSVLKARRNSSFTGTFKRLMSSPIKSSVNSRPEVVDSGTSTSTAELKRNKSIREIGTNLVRKISQRGKSPTPLNKAKIDEGEEDQSSEESGIITFRRAMMSATAASNGRVGGDPSLVCYEELLKLFQCPGCQTLMVPPFPQCRKGHIVCTLCKQLTKNVCPICKQRFADTPNLMMEQVFHLLKLPCRFSSHGCMKLNIMKQKGEHEAYCSYRPIPCHYSSNGCPKVLPYQEIHRHVPQCEFKDALQNDPSLP